jgi:hypothetical protein
MRHTNQSINPLGLDYKLSKKQHQNKRYDSAEEHNDIWPTFSYHASPRQLTYEINSQIYLSIHHF